MTQALLDTTALLACMVYVDLNPIRAGLANSLKTSDYTSIQQRLADMCKATDPPMRSSQSPTPRKKYTTLLPFVETEHRHSHRCTLPFRLKDYVDLVDWTGRVARGDKRGVIPTSQPPLLSQLGLSAQQWRFLSIDIQQQSLAALGSLEQLEMYHAAIHKRWMPKQTYLKRCYPNRA